MRPDQGRIKDGHVDYGISGPGFLFATHLAPVDPPPAHIDRVLQHALYRSSLNSQVTGDLSEVVITGQHPLEDLADYGRLRPAVLPYRANGSRPVPLIPVRDGEGQGAITGDVSAGSAHDFLRSMSPLLNAAALVGGHLRLYD